MSTLMRLSTSIICFLLSLIFIRPGGLQPCAAEHRGRDEPKKPKIILRTCSFQWNPLKPSPGSSCPPRLQYRVVFQTGAKKFHFFQILISQARNKLFENFKSLKSSSGHRLCIRTVIRNLLSSTTPFGGHEDTPILDVFRGISEGRPVNESC